MAKALRDAPELDTGEGCMGDTIGEQVRRKLAARTPHTWDDSSLLPAGVLLLMYPKDGEYHILFTKRTNRVASHKDEISFPGGGMQPGDAGIQATALRETREEIGVHPRDVELLGILDQESTHSGFLITPFVGTIPYPYPFRPSRVEVAEVLEVPVSHLLDPAFIEAEEQWIGDHLVHDRAYRHGEHRIWGATARILTGFLNLVGDELPWLRRESHSVQSL